MEADTRSHERVAALSVPIFSLRSTGMYPEASWWQRSTNEHGSGAKAVSCYGGNFPSTCLNTRWGRRDKKKCGDWSERPGPHTVGGELPSCRRGEGEGRLFTNFQHHTTNGRSQFVADVGEMKSAWCSLPRRMEVAVEVIRTKLAWLFPPGYWTPVFVFCFFFLFFECKATVTTKPSSVVSPLKNTF